MFLIRTCCFNYLRKRSSPPISSISQQIVNPELDENNIWVNRAELERLLRNELIREQSNINHLANQKTQSKEEFQKSTPTSTTNQNNHDQMRVIYEI